VDTKGSSEKWRIEREAAIVAGQPNPFESLDERARMWLQARKPKIVDGKPQFDQPKTEAVAKKMYELNMLQKQGKFKAKRDRDVLSTAIGSKEHGGHVRGLSSKFTIKDGFHQEPRGFRDCWWAPVPRSTAQKSGTRPGLVKC
jgi:hypothetical protein